MSIEKYKGVLLGCAVGDTLGMAVEGWKKEQIKKYVGSVREPMAPVIIKNEDGSEKTEDENGKLKYWTRDLKKGEWTDDTILTMAIAESIAEKNALDLEDNAKKHIIAYEALRMPDGRIKGGFGGTTQEAFKQLQAGKSPYHSGVIGGPGNAPAMKMHPVGMYMHATENYESGLSFARALGKMTHLDPRSIVSGIVQAHAIYALLDGVSRNELIHSVAKICKQYEEPLTEEFTWHKKGALLSRLEWISDNRDTTADEAHAHLGSSSAVYQSYPFSLFMLQKNFDSPLQGLIETVNYGGDCDTTGAIFGALAGARHGSAWLPSAWLDVLQGKERIVNAAHDIYALKNQHRAVFPDERS